jgi:hypothetical protein
MLGDAGEGSVAMAAPWNPGKQSAHVELIFQATKIFQGEHSYKGAKVLLISNKLKQ